MKLIVLGIRSILYRSRSLMTSSRIVFLEQILNVFRIGQAKKGFLLVWLRKISSLSRHVNNNLMKKRVSDILYALGVGSFMFFMLNARPGVTQVLGWRTCSRAILGWIDEQTLSIYFSVWWELKICFLVYGESESQLAIRSYDDASLTRLEVSYRRSLLFEEKTWLVCEVACVCTVAQST